MNGAEFLLDVALDSWNTHEVREPGACEKLYILVSATVVTSGQFQGTSRGGMFNIFRTLYENTLFR